MLLRIFKNTGAGVISLVALALIIFWLGPFISRPLSVLSVYETDPMPFYSFLREGLGENSVVGLLFSAAIVAVIAFILVDFNTSVLIISERTFLPALVYILFSGLFPSYQTLNPVLPSSLLLILALRRIMAGYRKQETTSNFFDAAILISTGSLFYFNLIWFGTLVIISITILKTDYFKDIIIALIGLAVPYLLTFGFYYVLDKDVTALLSLIHDNLFKHSSGIELSRLMTISLIYVSCIMLISVTNLIRMSNTKKIKSRKTLTILLWLFIICIVVYFLSPSSGMELSWIIYIPVSYFLTHYFVFIRRRIYAEIFFGLLVVCILAIQVLTLI